METEELDWSSQEELFDYGDWVRFSDSEIGEGVGIVNFSLGSTVAVREANPNSEHGRFYVDDSDCVLMTEEEIFLYKLGK